LRKEGRFPYHWLDYSGMLKDMAMPSHKKLLKPLKSAARPENAPQFFHRRLKGQGKKLAQGRAHLWRALKAGACNSGILSLRLYFLAACTGGRTLVRIHLDVGLAVVLASCRTKAQKKLASISTARALSPGWTQPWFHCGDMTVL
jgi:hypothetical protein